MLNRVTLIGNLGADPEIRVQESGVKMARLRIATTERVYLKESGTSREHTEWHTVIVWRSLAEFADKHLVKGCQLFVEGALRYREWVDRQDVKHSTVEIVASELKLLGRRERREGDEQSNVECSSEEGSEGGEVKIPF